MLLWLNIKATITHSWYFVPVVCLEEFLKYVGMLLQEFIWYKQNPNLTISGWKVLHKHLRDWFVFKNNEVAYYALTSAAGQ